MNWILRSVLIVSLITLTACVSAGKVWPEQTGIVLDAESREPIEGAIVVVRWIGTISALVDSQTTCYHVESATTDAQGRYRIPAWTKVPGPVGHNEVHYTVYKPGYRHVRTDMATGEQHLRRDTRGVKERLEYLISTSVSCNAGEDKKLSNLYRSLYSEAESIATTKEERAIALILLIEVEKQEVGSTEAWRRFEERKLELR